MPSTARHAIARFDILHDDGLPAAVARDKRFTAMHDPDVLFVARTLIRRYGDEAKRHALERISNLLDDGDAEACELWQKVADAIDELTTF